MQFPSRPFLLTAHTALGDPNLGWDDGYTHYRWDDVRVDGQTLAEEDDPQWFDLFCGIERHARCGEVKVLVDPLMGIVKGSLILPDGAAELISFRFEV